MASFYSSGYYLFMIGQSCKQEVITEATPPLWASHSSFLRLEVSIVIRCIEVLLLRSSLHHCSSCGVCVIHHSAIVLFSYNTGGGTLFRFQAAELSAWGIFTAVSGCTNTNGGLVRQCSAMIGCIAWEGINWFSGVSFLCNIVHLGRQILTKLAKSLG